MNQEEKNKSKDLGKLTDREANLIWRIRNIYRYGEIKVKLRDGQPFMIVQEVNYDSLDEN